MASLALLATHGLAADAKAELQDYTDPEGAWAIRIPATWKAVRQPIEDATMWTKLQGARGDDAEINVIMVPTAQQLDATGAEAMSRQLFDLALQAIGEDGKVTSRKISRSRFQGREILRCDATFQPDEGAARKGYLLGVPGQKNFALLLIASRADDAAGWKQAEAQLSTFALESQKPRAAGPTAAPSLLGAQAMKNMAQSIKGDLKREAKTKVLVAGDPPLTYGDVAGFANMIEQIFDIQFTEAEFETTKKTFIEGYRNGDAQAKAGLAGWDAEAEGLLKDLQTGTPEERRQKKQMAIDGFAALFEKGARAGIAWAKTMNEALERREQDVALITAKRPTFAQKPQYDNTLSEADLDAAVEMLYFMWVGAGRDANDVTPDALAYVRAAIVQQFDTYPAQLQYVLANAPQFYASLRATWAQANDAQQMAMARQFSADLDALGLTDEPDRVSGDNRITGTGGGAWAEYEGKDHGTLMAETVVGLAGSSYKSAW